MTGPACADDGADLLAWCERRDESAFRRVVERHGPMLRAAATRIAGSREADDVAQAAFLILLRHARRLHRNRDVGGWLYTVGVRLALRAQRKARRRKQVRLEECMAPGGEPDTHRIAPLLDAALARLGERERSAIVLHHLEGLPHAEIARRHGVAEGTVASWLSRGRERLRLLLGRSGLALSSGALVAALSAIPRPAACADFTADVIASASSGPGPGAAALLAAERTTPMLTIIAPVLGGIAATVLAAVAIGGQSADPPPAVPPPHAAEAVVPAADLGANAALGYLGACLVAADRVTGGRSLDDITDPEEMRSALDLVVGASRLERCDGGLRHHGQGSATVLPHVRSLRALARLLLARAEGRCAQALALRDEAARIAALSERDLAGLAERDRLEIVRRPAAARRAEAEALIDDAVADLVAALRLGCHLAGPQSAIIEWLVGMQMIDLAASRCVANLGILAERRDGILDALQRLPQRSGPGRLLANDLELLGLFELQRLLALPPERRKLNESASGLSDASITEAISVMRVRRSGLAACADDSVPDRALLEPMGDPLADIFFGAAKTIVSRHAEVRLRLALLRLAVTVPSGELPADAGARFGLTDPQRLPVGAGFSALDPTRGERVTLTAPATARPSPVPADAADPGF